VIVEETTSILEKFFPSTLPSKPIDIDESNKEDNRDAFDHSGDQGKTEAMATKKRDNRDSEEWVIIIYTVPVRNWKIYPVYNFDRYVEKLDIIHWT